MLCNGVPNSNTIEMVLYVFMENKMQYYIPYQNGQTYNISKAIKEPQLYVRCYTDDSNMDRIQPKDYIWNEVLEDYVLVN